MRPIFLNNPLDSPLVHSVTEDDSPIRLGRIGFINTVPIYSGLQQALTQGLQPRVQVISQTPMGLNQAIIANQLELSPVSTAWYAQHQHQHQLTLLPGLSVSSLGSVESVLLVSDFSLAEWKDQPIAVPDDSATSIAVLRALIHHHSGADPIDAFVVYPAHLQEQALQNYPAVLTIGDRALSWLHRNNREHSNTKQSIDLATAWQAFTGEPLVFAVWVARTEWLCHHVNEATQVMETLIDCKNNFLQSATQQHQAYEALRDSTTLPESVLVRYWTTSLDYGWSKRHQASVDRLVALSNLPTIPCLV